MEALRRASRLTCQLLLVWFALSLGAALASPVLQPQGADEVCSGSGIVLPLPLAQDEGGAADAAGHDHDCRLCTMVGAPPVPLVYAAHAVPAGAPVPTLPAPAPSRDAAPFQQRGPPLA